MGMQRVFNTYVSKRLCRLSTEPRAVAEGVPSCLAALQPLERFAHVHIGSPGRPPLRYSSQRTASLHARAQVCLAAETCGHVRFSIRGDTWYSGQAFECGTTQPEEVAFADLFYKVRGGGCMAGGNTVRRPFRRGKGKG